MRQLIWTTRAKLLAGMRRRRAPSGRRIEARLPPAWNAVRDLCRGAPIGETGRYGRLAGRIAQKLARHFASELPKVPVLSGLCGWWSRAGSNR